MKTLKIANALSLPLEAVTQKLAWLGVTGSGKTYGASKLAELLWHAGAQFIALDPVGVWYGLRLAKDGKRPSDVTVPIFGGLHGDVPLESTGGALLANLVVDNTLSAIIDVSQFETDADKARFARDFADRFFFRKKSAPSAVHLFLEECQEFVPQNPQKGEERMLHAFIRMQKLGRNFGIGSSYISQRPQEVNKKALNMAQTLFVFRTTGTHERKAIEQWIADKALDQDIAGDLPKIDTGACHVWSPEFLKISETVHILEKATFNASATPEVGAAAKARELAPIDLDQVRAEMAATIEKAKADDPRELRKQVAALAKELEAATRLKVSVQTGAKTKSVAVLADTDRALLEKLAAQLTAARERILTAEKAARESLNEEMRVAVACYWTQHSDAADRALSDIERRLESKGFQKILDKLSTYTPAQPSAVGSSRTTPAASQGRRVAPVAATNRPASLVSHASRERWRSASRGDGTAIGGGLRRILIALAQRPAGLTLRQVGVRAALSSKSGTFSTYMSRGRQEGWIQDGGKGGASTVTPAGLAALGDYEPLPTGVDLLRYWLGELGGGAARILQAVADAYPETLTLEQIGERVNLNYQSGTFSTYMSRLRTLELIESGRGWVRVSEELVS